MMAYGIAVDTSGNAYVTGTTRSRATFPRHCSVPSRPPISGANDAFVTKLNATGTGLVYSTYLGGNDLESAASGIAVEHLRQRLRYRDTPRSSDFPTTAGDLPDDLRWR